MSLLISAYWLVGLGVWLGICAGNMHTFKGATAWSITKGLGVALMAWPFALLIVCEATSKERKLKKEPV